jgi:hypothetical protein
MKTDELRAELRRISDEMEPFEGDLLAVHRNVRRYRAVWSAIAIAAMIALVVGALAIAHRSSRPPVTSKLVPTSQLRRVDVIVVPDNAAMRAIVQHSPLVDAYAPLPKLGPVRSGLFFRGAEAPVACALERNSGLAISAPTGHADITDGLQNEVGNKAKVYDISHGSDVEIFMKVAASAEQVANLKTVLGNDPAVTHVTFVDHAAALAEFRTIFKDQPALLQSTKASDLPESFDLQLANINDANKIESRYQDRVGVDTVITLGPFTITQTVGGPSTDQASCSTP